MTLILMAGLLITTNLVTGCASTNANKRYPIIPMPKRPVISSELSREDFKEIIKYAEQLEVGIKEYNVYAEEQNLKMDDDTEN